MTGYIALLRAVNVGGTGKLAMAELSTLAADSGLERVRTYIQSGNLLFHSDRSADVVRALLEDALLDRVGAPIDVVVRTADELACIVASNPFPEAPPAKVAVVFSAHEIPPNLIDGLTTPAGERIVRASRELYIHYPDGMGRSKLTLPRAFGPVTVRNVNTVTRLAALALE